jgi:hypothetical protein
LIAQVDATGYALTPWAAQEYGEAFAVFEVG